MAGIDAQARITLKGASEAIKQLQAISKSTRATSKEAQAAQKDSERGQRAAQRAHQDRMRQADATSKASARAAQQEQRDAARTASAKQKAAQEAQRAEERAAAAVRKIQEQQALRWQRIAQQSAAVRMRAEQQATATARREAAKQQEIAQRTAASYEKMWRTRNSNLGGLVGAATGGFLAGGREAVNTARSTTGARSVQERIQAGNDFRERLVRVTNDAGMTAEQREKVQGQVLEASKSTGIDIGELAGVLETGQGLFNNLPYFASQLENIGRIAKAGGADAQDLARAMGFANQAFEITGKSAEDTGFLMKGAANIGSIELSDLASSFAPLAGTFAETTKHKGDQGLREFLGMAEAMGTSGYTGERGATRLQGVLAAVSGVDTQDDLEKKAGIRKSTWVGRDGTLDIPALVRQLANSRQWQNASVRQDIFKDIRAQQGIEGLVSANRRTKAGVEGAVDIDTFLGMNAAGGRASVDAGMVAMQKEGFFKAQVANANMQVETMGRLEEFNGQLELVTSASNKLEQAFGSLSLWASTISSTGIGSAVGGTIGKVALGGGAIGVGAKIAGVGGAAGAAGTAGAAGAGSILGALSLAAAPLVAGFTAQQSGLDKPLEEFFDSGGFRPALTKVSKSIGLPDWAAEVNGQVGGFIANRIADTQLGAPRIGAAIGRGYDWLTGGGGGASPSGPDASKEIVRELKDINSGLRANLGKGPLLPSREPK